MAARPARVSHVEVERKFIPTARLLAQLEGNHKECERLRLTDAASKAMHQPSKSFVLLLKECSSIKHDKMTDHLQLL